MIDCPKSDRLRLLLDGQLPEAEQLELQQHIDSCERCQQTLEGLVAGKESWDGIARRLADGDAPVTPALHEAIAAAKELDATNHTVQLPPNFLQPSEQADSMGRLAHYEVLQEVGSGGMGIVLKAFDTSLRRVVAIKVMAPHLAANPAARRRFVREAQAAAAVAHEHVVAIHAVADQHEPPYLAMQFIEGQTLQERLDKSGPLTVREVLRIGMQTAAGLAAAHAQGLVHRDIKPANILLENGVERVKLTDFGLARAVDDASVTQSGFIAGTPLFMSPEQARGEAVDHRSDLFSLGSVLYAMCAGHSPFRASTTMGVIKRVCDESPRPIRDANPDVPDWLVQIIDKLLAKNATDRFASAKDVADLLGQCLAHFQQPATVSLPTSLARATGVSPVRTETASQHGQDARGTETMPGWRLRCTTCGTTRSLASVGGVRIGAASKGKFTLGWCSVCRALRWTAVEWGEIDPKDVLPIDPRRSVARAAVGLIATGLVNWLAIFVILAWLILHKNPSEFQSVAIPVFSILAVGSGVILFGAFRMLSLDSYRWAKTAAICAMFIGPGYLIGWPCGLWALAVLARRDVREEFESKRAAAADPASASAASPPKRRWWNFALIGLAMAVLCGVLLFPYAERMFDGRTAELKLELAGPHVEVTLNGVKVAVTDKGEAAMHMRPGDYEVVGLKDGQFAGSSIYLLHSGIPLTADNREFEAVRVTGPRTLEYGPGSAPPTIADYTAIQGRWTIVSQMKDGHPSPASQRSKWIELDYDLFRSDAPGTTPNVPNVQDTRFSINPSAEPKHIDFVGLRAKGIYRLDGDTLTLAIAEVGHPRPTAFESQYGSPVTLTVCQRADDWAKRDSTSNGNSAQALPDSTAELDRLVELAEQDLRRVRARVENELAPTMQADEAEGRLIEVRVRRAKVRKDQAEVVSQLRRLVEIRELNHSRTGIMVKAATVPKSELAEAEKRLLEAKLQLKEAEAAFETTLVSAPGIAWGQTSPMGMQLGIQFDRHRGGYRVGEVVKLRLFLRNAGKTALSTTLPRLEVLEKFGFDLSLLDDQDKPLTWSWGKAHKSRELFTVSGGMELPLRPGAIHELPAAEIVIGKEASSPTTMAVLDVEPGQTCHLVCKLGTYGYAKGEGEPLESGQVHFRVGAQGDTPATAPASETTKSTK